MATDKISNYLPPNQNFEEFRVKPDLKNESVFDSVVKYITEGSVIGAISNVVLSGIFKVRDHVPFKQFLRKTPIDALGGAIGGGVILGTMGLVTSLSINDERGKIRPYVGALEQQSAALHDLLPMVARENAENKKHIAELEKERAALLAQIPDGVKR